MKRRISLYKNAEERVRRIHEDETGFTLIETLAVLTIIAILAAALIPMLNGFTEDARRKAYVAETYLVMAAAQAYVIEKNADGMLDDFEMYNEIIQYEVSDPSHALYGVLKGSVTKGAYIKGITYEASTSRVSGIIYCVKKYEIEIEDDSEVRVRDGK